MRHHPLAGPHQAEHRFIRDVFDHGLLADICQHYRRQDADRPTAIDGVDQSGVLLGNSAGQRESLLSFIGGDLVAVRWKQWRIYFTDIHPTGEGPQREPGIFSASAPMAGYPKVFNIEMDPHEDLVLGGMFGWVSEPALKVVDEYLASVKKYPNPPAPNITRFGGG